MWIKNPQTNRQDVMLTMSVLAVAAAIIKFLVEGISITVLGHNLSFGHVDAFTYGLLLTPILGAHGYMDMKNRARKAAPAKEEGETHADQV